MPDRFTIRQKGTVLAAGGVLLISLDALWIRLSGAGSWEVVFWVGLFTLIALSVLIPVRTGDSIVFVVRRDGRPLLVSALLNTVSITFFILAIGATSVANTVAIIAATPVIAALVARTLIGERASRRTWVGIAGSVVGILIIVSGSIGAGSIGGDLFAVFAVLAFAVNMTIWRRHPQMSRMGVFGLGGLFVALVAVVPADPMTVGAPALAILALMGMVTGPAGRVALSSAPRFLPAAQVGLFTPIETIAATAWAWIFLSEPPTQLTIAGGVVVIGAVIYGTRGPDRNTS